ncbi:hypothetical protein [Streptomyces sp. NBC_01262]|uniref:hypothetical protein n=1 Tax=Streptomyces sp. NBC_01262 TaxID=2903803 RepID=UPI002E36424F|nr:hypothetical protein [Streptomyces sp. NBC_01262]
MKPNRQPKVSHWESLPLWESENRQFYAMGHRPVARNAGGHRETQGSGITERLRAWPAALFTTKRRKARATPELFATDMALMTENSGVVDTDSSIMVEQDAGTTCDGIASSEPTPADFPYAAQAVWETSIRFHYPAHADDWPQPGINDVTAVCDLILRGLAA